MLVVDPPLVVSGTLDNASLIVSSINTLAVELSPGAYLRNEATGTIADTALYAGPVVQGLAGGASTITNLGTISNAGQSSGIDLLAGGRVTNGAAADGPDRHRREAGR